MDNKELKIIPPSGYEIDKENSTLECIKFKPIKKKKLTYDDIARELFEKKETFWIGSDSSICSEGGVGSAYKDVDNCTSEKQVEKLIALNKLMNVAKYLNGKEKLDFTTASQKWAPRLLYSNGDIIEECWTATSVSSPVYFRTPKLLKQAIEILGEDTIKLALSTDW